MEMVKITILPRGNKKGELVNACRMISEQTRNEPGCQHCNISNAPDSDNPVEMKLYWQQMNLLEDYFRTDHFSALLGAIKMLAIDFELVINDGSPTEGSLAVDRARDKK
jgi:quinol monooxygenase YgiN